MFWLFSRRKGPSCTKDARFPLQKIQLVSWAYFLRLKISLSGGSSFGISMSHMLRKSWPLLNFDMHVVGNITSGTSNPFFAFLIPLCIVNRYFRICLATLWKGLQRHIRKFFNLSVFQTRVFELVNDRDSSTIRFLKEVWAMCNQW